MSALPCDTPRLSRTLRDKRHFTSDQAETLAEALGEASQDNLATKVDIAALKADIVALKSDIDGLRSTTKADLAEMKSDLLKWIVGAIGFQTIVSLGAAFAMARVIKP